MNYKLVGLNCAHCAEKIRIQIENLEYVESAGLSLVNQRLSIIAANLPDNFDLIVESIVHKFEPDVEVKREGSEACDTARKDTDFIKNILERKNHLLAIAVVLFVASFVVKNESISLYLNVIAYLIAGFPVLRAAALNLAAKQPLEENFLMTIATIGAWITDNHHEAVGVMIFYGIGEMIQDLAVDNSRKSISKLLEIAPDFANVLVGNSVRKVKPEAVSVGDIIIVRPFERVPLDGVVIKGMSSIDTAAITGESTPVDVEVGDKIYSGSINQSGLLGVRVEASYANSTVAKILNLVENANDRKAPTERFVTRFAKIYTPVVVGIAILLATIVPLVTQTDFYTWFYRAMVFLVISCPCALVLSIPLGYFCGIGVASKKGVLIKGGESIDALLKIKSLLFDKTGTLTKGNLSVVSTKVFEGFDKLYVSEVLGAVEKFSSHPIAKAITSYYNSSVGEATDFVEIAGRGVKCVYAGETVLLGNEKLLVEHNVKLNAFATKGTTVHLAVGNRHAAVVNLADAYKEGIVDSINKIKNVVPNLILASGDKAAIVKSTAEDLGIDSYYAQLLPQDKLALLNDLREKSSVSVGFVGDGINDAPVLTAADVGIAMGALGSDAAIEAADIVIMNDDLSSIEKAILIAKKTNRIIKENIFLIITIKIIVLILGAFGIAHMWIALLSDVGVAILAVLNSSRILKYD